MNTEELKTQEETDVIKPEISEQDSIKEVTQYGVNIAKTKVFPMWYDFLVILGIMIVASVFGGVAGMIFGHTNLDGSQTEFTTFLTYTVTFILTIIVTALYKTSRTQPAKETIFRFSLKKTNPAITLWGVVLMLSMGIVIEPIINLMPEKWLDLLKQAIGTGGWTIMSVVVAAAILEEMLFRGLIQESATKKWGAGIGIIVASLMFGIIHGIPQQIVGATFLGLVLGYVYYRTQSLIPVIILHAVNNTIAFISMQLANGENMSTRELIGNDTHFYMLYSASLFFVVLGAAEAVRYIKRNNTHEKSA